MALKSNRLYDCPKCGTKGISPFRFAAHGKSRACAETQRVMRAMKQLRDVGGYEKYAQNPTLLLIPTFGQRPTRVLAAGIDDLGHMTIIDMDGYVRQYLHGEWAWANERDKSQVMV